MTTGLCFKFVGIFIGLPPCMFLLLDY